MVGWSWWAGHGGLVKRWTSSFDKLGSSGTQRRLAIQANAGALL